MSNRLRRHLTYANVMATAAVFLALGGVSYAAVAIPKNSVGNQQLKPNAVTTKKVKNGTLLAADFRRRQPRAAPPGREAQRARPVLKDLRVLRASPARPARPASATTTWSSTTKLLLRREPRRATVRTVRLTPR